MHWKNGIRIGVVCLMGHLALWSGQAHAVEEGRKGKGNDGVGIAVMGGVAHSPTQIRDGNSERAGGTSAAWGMFVDIPIVPMFYIAPATTLYQVNFPNKNSLVTDLDLNLKLVVPLLLWRLGIGGTAGVSNAESRYHAHYGALVYFGFQVIPMIEFFIMGQYKRIARNEQDVDNIHGFLGLMVKL